MVESGTASRQSVRVAVLAVAVCFAALVGAVFAVADTGGPGCGYGGSGDPAYCQPTFGSAVITGTVLQQGTDAPLQYANVTVRETTTGVLRGASTDSLGSYVVGQLPAGTYTVQFSRYGHTTEWFDGAADVGGATPITLANGQVVFASAQLAVLPAAIQGTVTDDLTHLPVAGVCIQASLVPALPYPPVPPPAQLPGSCAGAFTGPTGAYALGVGVTGPYSYILQVSDPQGRYATEYYLDETDPEAATPVSVPAVANFAVGGAGDDDGDGVIEPPGYDGNGDFVPDDQQENVTTLPAADGGGAPVTIVSPDGDATLIGAFAQPAFAGPTPPPGVDFPVGVFGFTLQLRDGVTEVDVDVILPPGTNPTSYYKLQGGVWIDFTANVDIFGDTVTLHLVDGGAGDADGFENSVIIDPGAPGALPDPTTTVITSDAPDPSITGFDYPVAGTVTVNGTGPASGDLPGQVDVSGDGTCSDTTLSPTGTLNEFAFSCTLSAGAPGTKTLQAEYTDSGTAYVPSTSVDEAHEVVAVPPAPTGVTATKPGPGSRATVIDAVPPQSPVTPTGYQIRCIPVGLPANTGPSAETGARWEGATSFPATVDGLTRGLTYHCKVRARYGPDYLTSGGDAYEGPLSNWSNAFRVPVSVPPAPTAVNATQPQLPSGQSTKVSWTSPVNETGAPVSFATRCLSSNGGAPKNTTGASPVTLTGLTKGATYVCSVRATNSAGSSPWASAPAIVVPPAAPTNVVASAPTAAGRSTSVKFTPGSGGPPVTSFRVQCTPTGSGAVLTGSGPGSPVVVSNLVRGKTYRCTVNPMFGLVPGAVSGPSNAITVP